MKYKNDNLTHRLVLASMLAGLILLLTMVSFPIPHVAGAYVNLGDAGVFVAAFLLGNPFGALCAAVGSALADLILGSTLYALPTFFIKGGMAVLAALLMKRVRGKTVFALMIAGLLMPIGYFAFETALFGVQTAALGIPANLLQYAAGLVLGMTGIRIVSKLVQS